MRGERGCPARHLYRLHMILDPLLKKIRPQRQFATTLDRTPDLVMVVVVVPVVMLLAVVLAILLALTPVQIIIIIYAVDPARAAMAR